MAVQLQNVILRFQAQDGSDIPVLDVPEFAVADGEHVCIVGPSGCGKTSLLHVIAGVLRPDAGRVRHGDVDLVTLREAERDRFRARNIGYVFQTFNLLPALTSRENVALALTLAGRSSGEAMTTATKLLQDMGLGARLDALPDTLSSGEQQRVAVARAVVKRPPLVLADEPTANLDDEAAAQALSVLTEGVRSAGSALIVVTHDARARGEARVVSMAELQS